MRYKPYPLDYNIFFVCVVWLGIYQLYEYITFDIYEQFQIIGVALTFSFVIHHDPSKIVIHSRFTIVFYLLS